MKSKTQSFLNTVKMLNHGAEGGSRSSDKISRRKKGIPQSAIDFSTNLSLMPTEKTPEPIKRTDTFFSQMNEDTVKGWMEMEKEENNDEEFVKERLCWEKLKRMHTPIIELPKPDLVDTQLQEIGELVERNPVEILEEMRKDKIITCFALRYAFSAIRYYVQSYCWSLIQHPLFEAVSLLVILANCVTLSLDDPTSENADWMTTADYVFQALYTLEIIVKVLGLGFVFNQDAYLRDAWNVLDFIIVIVGYLSYMELSGGLDLKALRSFRILRPLRTISSVEGLKILMTALVSSFPLLADTLVIMLFFFMIFAIAGVQLWHGILTTRCFNIETGEINTDEVCGFTTCSEGYTCVDYISNPNYDVTNFDNLFSALLTVFQCVTMEGWADTQYLTIRAFGPYAIIFFTPLVIIGAFFLINFTLAVIKSRVSKLYEENRRLKELAKKKSALSPEELEAQAAKRISLGTLIKSKAMSLGLNKYQNKFKLLAQRCKMKSRRKAEINLHTIYQRQYGFNDIERILQEEEETNIEIIEVPYKRPIYTEAIKEEDESSFNASLLESSTPSPLRRKSMIRVEENIKKSLLHPAKIAINKIHPPYRLSSSKEIHSKDKTRKLKMKGVAGLRMHFSKEITKDLSPNSLYDGLEEFTDQFFGSESSPIIVPFKSGPSSKISNLSLPQFGNLRSSNHEMQSIVDSEEFRNMPLSEEATPSAKPQSGKLIESILENNGSFPESSKQSNSNEKPCVFEFNKMPTLREQNTTLSGITVSPHASLVEGKRKMSIMSKLNKLRVPSISLSGNTPENLKQEDDVKILPIQKVVSSARGKIGIDTPSLKSPRQVAEDFSHNYLMKFILKKKEIESNSAKDVQPKPQMKMKLQSEARLLLPPYKVKIKYCPTQFPVHEKKKNKTIKTRVSSILKSQVSSPKILISNPASRDSRKRSQKKITKVEDNSSVSPSKCNSLTKNESNSRIHFLHPNRVAKKENVKLNNSSSMAISNSSIIKIQKKEDVEEEEEAEKVSVEEQIFRIKTQQNSTNKQEVFWSGQEVMLKTDPDGNENATSCISAVRIWHTGWKGSYSQIRSLTRKIAGSTILENVMNLFVLINTMTLAMERYGQPEDESDILYILNLVFSSIFMLELVVKVFGLGVVGYLSDPLNYLDAAVVLFSIVEIIFLDGQGAISAFRTLRIFRVIRMVRTLRVLRVARLLRSLRSMQTIIEVIGKTISSFAYIGLLLIILIFIYALFGMQLYGGAFDFNDGKPRQNFDSFHNAFLSIFQVLTLENWQDLLYSCFRARSQIISSIYIISWIFIGNYILLNLLLAIMLDAFSAVDEEISKEAMNEESSDELRHLKSSTDAFSSSAFNPNLSHENSFDEVPKNKELTDDDLTVTEKSSVSENILFQKVKCIKSFYLFSKENVWRRLSWKIVSSDYFEWIIIGMICVGSALLAVGTYFENGENETVDKIEFGIDLFLTISFSLEALLKSVAFGFVFDKNSYLRDSWNQLDFCIVIASIANLSISNFDIPMIKILRLFRTFRPLRFVTHNANMRIIVTALFQSLGAIFNTLIVVLVIWLMFSIVGVNFFAGKFQYCSVDIYENSYREDCEANGGKWMTYDHNFDNSVNGLIFLFILTTQENWPSIVYQAIDCTDVDKGPEKGGQYYYAYYFVFFLFIGSMFLLNLFVGVMFLHFTKVQKKEAASFGDIMISEDQLNWIEVQKFIIRAEPNYNVRTVPPMLNWRKPIHDIVTSTIFEIFIAIIILLNMIQMAMLYEDASDDYLFGLEIVNYIFTGIFTIEVILKLIAFAMNYWYEAWNVFDFIIVICSSVDIIVSNLSTSSLRMLRIGPQLIRVLRVLRISRLLRLVKKYKRLQDIMEIIQLCLPSMMNVFSLLTLILFIYSILGCYLFKDITEGKAINDFYNFSNFGLSLVLCFKIATGEDWNIFMFDCARTTTGCAAGMGCGDPVAYIYFLSFKLVVTFIMLNLFILIVLQLFEKYFIETENIISKFKEDFEVFQNSWLSLEPTHSGYMIGEEKLIRFFGKIPEPIGMEGMGLNEMSREILQLHIKSTSEKCVFFNELLFCTMRRVYSNLVHRNEFIKSKELETREKIQKMANIASLKSVYSSTRKNFITTANPFVSLMLLRMTFKMWMHYKDRHFKRLKEFEKKGFMNYDSDEEERSPSTLKALFPYIKKTESRLCLPKINQVLPVDSTERCLNDPIAFPIPSEP